MREADLAEVLRVVGEPTRVQLLRYLLDEEHCVTQCMEHTGLPQSAVSKHLGRLVDAGIVVRRRSGRRSYHGVADPQGVEQLLQAAEALKASQPA